MKLTKYWNAYSGIAGIKTDNYSSTISVFLKLVEIARQQFSELSDEDIRIVFYRGDRWMNQFGIEFRVEKEECPPGYTEVDKLEHAIGNW